MRLNKARLLDDLHVVRYVDLPSPAQLRREVPLTEAAVETIFEGRLLHRRVYKQKDKRMLVNLGGCSEFDQMVNAEMTHNITQLQPLVADVMILVKRTMVEKPRTRKEGTINTEWGGVVTDPDLNGTRDMVKGLRIAREMLLYCAENGVYSLVEFVNPIIEQYISDLVVHGVVGARSTPAPLYREMATGSSSSLSIKNTTDGELIIPINAIITAKYPSVFPGINPETGEASAVYTRGNKYAWLVLRGTAGSPNYDADSVAHAQEMLAANGLRPVLGIDTNHSQSRKDPTKQPAIFLDVMRQRRDGNDGIIQVISEVTPIGGSQKIPENLKNIKDLEYGKSVTDATLGWDEAREMVLEGASILRASRRA